jgi:branched-chain amino acid transport system ATP-binding protein
MLLELKQVTVHYEKAEAIKDVSIDVNEGEIVTIIGSNGAGKTTTLKAIASLVHPDSGEIWLEGHRIDRLAPEKIAMRGISFSMEGRRLFPFMTVFENLQMGAYCRKDKDIGRDLEGVFCLFPVLLNRQRQKAGTLSGGEQQMLTIGRALMSRPRLLLIDEPSMGLAPMIVSYLAKTLKEYNQKTGLTILLVEQNAQMALKLADRGYVLEVGKIVTKGDSQYLRNNDHVRRAYLGV